MRNESLSFSELVDLSRSLGAAISSKGISGTPVAVWAERSIYTPVLFFGVLYSGNYYVPINPDMPIGKIEAILQDVEPSLLLVADTDSVSNIVLSRKIEIMTLDSIPKGGADCPLPPGADAPLYAIYTSGSTGRPKGIIKSHRAEISFLESYCRTFDFSENDVIANQTPFFFDASAKDIYLMAKIGATMDIVPVELFMNPVELIRYLNDHGATFISWVPTALVIVSKLNTFKLIKPTTLRKVFFVGESMPLGHLNKWREALPDVEFVNLYGFSEIAGIACYYRIVGDPQPDAELPIGRPLDNCRIFLISNGKNVVDADIQGELYISSDALAKEYLNAPEMTARSFVDLPSETGETARCFRTGDLARYDRRGDLVFVSRNDFQVKHMGCRVELGEIECAAEKIDGVQRACCVFEKEKAQIHMYCEVAPGSELTRRGIFEQLNKMLSSYMIPERIFIVSSLPINSNGKIDRQRLKMESQRLNMKHTGDQNDGK